MFIPFNKYQGAGNDFIIIDNRRHLFDPAASELIKRMCDRRFGIGADGLILISEYEGVDFEMKYYNSDGLEGSMCGNGGRCSADFSIRTNIADETLTFRAVDGVHSARAENGIIRLSMNDVTDYEIIGGHYFINTGSPHYVIFRDDINSVDVRAEGRVIRWDRQFSPGGTNVNFVESRRDGIYVRTFERGVEDETLACGTGVTASAIVSVLSRHFDTTNIPVTTRGGRLSVSFKLSGSRVTNIWLSGPATFVYSGEIEV